MGDTIADLAWSPTGCALALGGSGGDIVTVDGSGDVITRRLLHPLGTTCVTWLGDDVVSGGLDGRLWIGGRSERMGGHIAAVAVADGQVAVAHGRQVTLLGGPTSSPRASTTAGVRFTPDHQHLVTCGFGYVTELDLVHGHEADLELRWGGSVETVTWASSGDWAAAGTRGETNYLWRRPDSAEPTAGSAVVPAGEAAMVLPCPSSTGRLIDFDTSGDHLGVGTRGGLAVFDLADADPTRGPRGRLLPVFCRINALVWWPDAPVVVLGVDTGGTGGGLLLIRCDDDASPVGVVDLASPVTGLAWSPEHTTLAVACVDGLVHALERAESWDWRASRVSWTATDEF